MGDFLSRLVVEISKQVDNVRYSVSICPNVANLEIQRTIKVSKPSPQLDAVGVAFYVTLIKLGIGSIFEPNDILVSVPTTAGLPPKFLPKRSLITSKINGLQISFPPQWLWAPFSLNWDQEQVPRGEFSTDNAGEATLSYLRRVLTENIGHDDLSLKSFSDICGMHPRGIQRILSAQGISYSQLKDDVRQSIIKDLLANTTLPITQIALHASFSGSAALSRAFRRWTGKTPSQFRADIAPDQIAH